MCLMLSRLNLKILKINVLIILCKYANKFNLNFKMYKVKSFLIMSIQQVGFLIILQTSSTIYKISNKECNVNIFGYPIISDINAKIRAKFG